MAWIVLVISGMLETVWAVALERSAGFTRPLPVAVFGIGLLFSMAGLGYALRSIPVGTGYAVWVGVGVVVTAVTGIVALGEPATLPRIICLILVVAGIAGLKIFH
jgi:quaternary ammonium compound-resistance protein SugE